MVDTNVATLHSKMLTTARLVLLLRAKTDPAVLGQHHREGRLDSALADAWDCPAVVEASDPRLATDLVSPVKEFQGSVLIPSKELAGCIRSLFRLERCLTSMLLTPMLAWPGLWPRNVVSVTIEPPKTSAGGISAGEPCICGSPGKPT